MKKACFVAAIFIVFVLCVPASGAGSPPRVDPTTYIIVGKAQQAMKDKDYAKARQILEEYTGKDPKKKHYLTEFTLANVFSLSGKDKEALTHYRASVELYPEFAYAWQNMGKIHFDLKQYGKAADCILNGYEFSDVKDPSVLYFAAVSWFLAGEHEKALPHLRYLVSGDAGTAKIEWLEAFLQVCMELHLNKEAFDTVVKLIDKDGGNPRLWKILANLHLQEGDYKSGVAALTVYSYLTPLKKEELLMLGNLNRTIGLPLNASYYYEKFIAAKEDANSEDYERLASAYLAAHKPVETKEVLSRALKKKPTYELWSMLGHVLYEEEKWEDSYQAFKKAAPLDRKEGKACLMMGYCALQMDRKDLARSAFKKAASFPKQRKMAKELLNQVSCLSGSALSGI